MESNQLVAKDVVARCNIGELGGPLLGLGDLRDCPAGWGLGVQKDASLGGETALVDLEPTLARAVTRLEVSSALVEPHHNWALAVSPLVPDGGDGITRLGCGSSGCGCASIAAHASGRGRHYGVVAGPLALDGIL